MPRRTIPELLAAEVRDAPWLSESLQSAIELEFATIPLYLSAMWSIANHKAEVYYLIRSVVMEEMLHMSLACNMLKGIGGSPQIIPPTFPGTGLPGNVMPDLQLYLAGLNYTPVEGQGLAPIDMFMEIEHPAQPVRQAGETPETFAAATYGTIGEFYTAIGQAFQDLKPSISTTGQCTANIGVPDPNDPGHQPPPPPSVTESLQPLAGLDDVLNAIASIIDQGEGTSTSPDSPVVDPGELAHYYRFGEIKYGKRFVQVNGEWGWQGDPVPFPECYPVAAVPSGGYPGVAEVETFGQQYATLLSDLQGAWNGTGQSSLDPAIGDMSDLQETAKTIVVKAIPGSSPPANYGPDFIPRSSTGSSQR